MATPYGKTGASTRTFAGKSYHKWLVLILFGLLLFFAYLQIMPHLGGFGPLAAAATGLLFLSLLPTLNRGGVRDAREVSLPEPLPRREIAAETVEALLGRLNEEHLVLHDVHTPHGHIHHIVITRPGYLFMIETRVRSGKVAVSNGKLLVSGRQPEKNFIGEIVTNRMWLDRQIRAAIGVEPWINAILVFSNAFVEPNHGIRSVAIINRRTLLSRLKHPASHPHSMLWEQREAA
jgi:hypothetical protein